MSDLCCYSNDGHSMRFVPSDYSPESGELLFPAVQTPEQLAAAFPDYAPAAQKLSVQSQIAVLEGMVTPRRLREALGGASGKTWLANIESQISALRAQL